MPCLNTMDKHKFEIMEKERKNFVYGAKKEDGTVECVGAIKNGVPEKVAHEIFDEMSSFASYAFNKSHAAAYAFVSYQTAYLKCYFPKEFMAAILTSVLDTPKKILEYIEECNRLNIKITPPDVNISNVGFTVHDDTVNFGLVAVKNVGRGFIASLIEERQRNGAFKSLTDFCQRMYNKDMSRKNLESLIKAGTFDSLHRSRKSMLAQFPAIISNIQHKKRVMLEGQLSLFEVAGTKNNSEDRVQDEEFFIDDTDEFSVSEKLNLEKEVIGLYISGHPLDKYKDEAANTNFLNLLYINDEVKNKNKRFADNAKVMVIGVINNIEFKITKSGRTMAFVVIEDRTSNIELLIFANVLDKFKSLIVNDNIIVVKGLINIKDETEPKIIVDKLILADEFFKNKNIFNNNILNNNKFEIGTENKKTKRKGLYLKVETRNSSKFKRSQAILEIFEGNTPVYLYFEDEKKLLAAPRNLWVDINQTMFCELRNILGENNVIFIK